MDSNSSVPSAIPLRAKPSEDVEVQRHQQHRKALIGSKATSNYWLHSTRTGFDLTHPSSSPQEPLSSAARITLETTTSPITVDASKSALIIIDMQNFFLAPEFGRSTSSAGHKAMANLVNYGIPAARKAGIRIIWLNWGLTDEDLKTMPPAVKRCFGFEAVREDGSFSNGISEVWDGFSVDRFGEVRNPGLGFREEPWERERVYRGLGSWCGQIKLDNGTDIEAGRLLVRDSWNAALYPPLDSIYSEGANLERRPDVWVHKDRMSGLWGAKTACEEFLEREGIKTLLFAGVNTDQCVGGTMTDAFSKGYDCVLLSDGCGTSSPDFAQELL